MGKRPTGVGAKPGGSWMAHAIFAAVVLAVSGSITWYRLHGPVEKNAPAKREASVKTVVADTGWKAGYVGIESCAECHASIVKSFQHVAMGRSLYRPTQSNIIENYTTGSLFYHPSSREYFRMSHEVDGKFYQARYQVDASGNKVNEKKVRIDYIIGSGNHARSYAHEGEDGKLYQLPVAWYPQEQRWAMEPGYDSSHHMGFSRRISYDCIFCHASFPKIEPGSDASNFAETSYFQGELQPIDCERCHGPAQKHVELARRKAPVVDIKAAILNPASLSPERELEVCMQCHLETTSGKLPHDVHLPGQSIFSYRPGEPLENYRISFNHPEGTGHDDKFEIAGQAYRMRMSRCFTASGGKMTCTTCHDPHKVPRDRTAAAIESCQLCHQLSDCTEKPELRQAAKDNCIQCHMPQRRTDDAIHVVMTDHYIQKHPPPKKWLLAPRQESNRDYKGELAVYYPSGLKGEKKQLALGLAYVSDGADNRKGIELLTGILQKNPDLFDAVYTRGIAYKIAGETDSARKDLEHAVALRPRNPQAQMALADLYEQVSDYTEAEKYYQEAIAIDPRISRAYNGLGSVKMLNGDLSGAEKAFREAIAKDPLDIDAPLNLAGLYLRQNRMEDAEKMARVSLAINPGEPDGWIDLAQSMEGLEKHSDAAEAIRQAALIHPGEEALYQLLDVITAHMDFAEREKTLTTMTQALPFASRALLARMLADSGQNSRALAVLNAVPTSGTASASAMAGCAEIGLRLGQLSRAMEWAQTAHQKQPDNAAVVIQLALALQESSRDEEADKLLQAAIRKQESPQLLNARAWLLATAQSTAVRDPATAEVLVNQAVGIMGRSNLHTLSTLAAAQAGQGRYSDASATIGQALQMAAQLNDPAMLQQIQAQEKAYAVSREYRPGIK